MSSLQKQDRQPGIRSTFMYFMSSRLNFDNVFQFCIYCYLCYFFRTATKQGPLSLTPPSGVGKFCVRWPLGLKKVFVSYF